MTIFPLEASGLRVELEDSDNIVIVEPRLRDDVRITVTNVDALMRALHAAVELRDIRADLAKHRSMTLEEAAEAVARTAAPAGRRRRIPVPVDLTPQQRRVVETPGVMYLGRDAKGRPVVAGLSGIPQQVRRWALARSGDPLDVREPVTPPGDTGA